MSNLGERLIKLRTQRKLSQEQLAEKLKTSKSSIGMYERNLRNPPIETLNQIADFFDTTVDFLLGRNDQYISKSETPVLITENLVNYDVRDNLDIDDEIFFDDYLEASEEEKKQLRKYLLELKRQRKQNTIKEDDTPNAWDAIHKQTD